MNSAMFPPLTIEPMLNQGTRHVHLNYNDDWTVYTDDGKLSAQWEHTFLVTEDGVEVLNHYPKELQIIE